MMMNLFSIFDPSTSLNFSLNLLSMFYVVLFVPMIFWFIPSRMLMIYVMFLQVLMKEFFLLLNLKKNMYNIFIFLSVFIFIFLNNFIGMFPYIFVMSSQLTFSLSLSMVLWVSFMFYGWIYNSNHMFIHLVPQNTPGVLMPFMVLIESLSNFIRAGTLSVRLSANMIAGHLLMALISMNGESSGVFLLLLIVVIQSLLVVLELSVSLIQAYVFSVLSTLYSSEVNYENKFLS
uniref:ATP synthase subunit a n=1 Tax=Aenasius arizonensis TaxID=2058190 RepID=A0A6B9XQS9_9HYME|nr:ATP synthase F0 subunit 6 [Aenasius arizonensis]QHR84892.1 ATP synthase F0 subunit 6 [Aenasius arizonensis]